MCAALFLEGEESLAHVILGGRIAGFLAALHWPIVALFTRMQNIFCHLTVAPATTRIADTPNRKRHFRARRRRGKA